MSQENEFNESEVIEDDIVDEVEDNEEDLQDEDVEESGDSDTIADLRAKLARAEKAIVKSKQKGSKKTSKTQKTNNKFESQVDLLRFNGVTSEEIDKLKKIAVMEDIDLIDARNSDYFTMYKDKLAKEETSRQATVGSSKRGRQTTYTPEKVKGKVGSSDKFSRDDVKFIIHGK